MSRTKKRIKKLLKKALPFAALAGGAMLLNRGKKPNMDIPDRNRGMMPTGIDKVIEDVAVPKNIVNPNLNKLPITSANVQRGLVDPPLAGVLKRIRAMDRTGTAGDIAGEAAMFKDGGKVVKTGDEPKKGKKKTRIQIRGFGKARR
tara:strand:- start:20 stop:457 length:438 start_codon:yes stop_codon:yes gene_type:complete